MALKSARAGGLDIGEGMAGAEIWLERVWKATNPNWEQIDPYEGKSGFPYQWNSTTDEINRKNGPQDLTCVGALCAVFLGHDGDSPMLSSMVNTLVTDQMQSKWPLETYYLYYSTLAVFQAGGERWRNFNAVTRDLLVENQRVGEGCFDGSWDVGTRTTKDWGGRILSTAYCCLSLEVYYRYAQVAGH